MVRIVVEDLRLWPRPVGRQSDMPPPSLPSFPNTPMLLSSALWLCNIGPTLSYYRKLSWWLRILVDVSKYCID